MQKYNTIGAEIAKKSSCVLMSIWEYLGPVPMCSHTSRVILLTVVFRLHDRAKGGRTKGGRTKGGKAKDGRTNGGRTTSKGGRTIISYLIPY